MKQAPITAARNTGKKSLDVNEDFCGRLVILMAWSQRLVNDDGNE